MNPAAIVAEALPPDDNAAMNPAAAVWKVDGLLVNRIKALRLARQWRQIDVARAAGVSINTVTGLEAGRKTQKPNVEKIAHALGTTVEELRRGDATEQSVVLYGLTDEDLRIARAYHNAETPVRIAVHNLLFRGADSFDARIARLTVDRRNHLRRMLELEETNQRAEETKKRRPLTKDRKA